MNLRKLAKLPREEIDSIIDVLVMGRPIQYRCEGYSIEGNVHCRIDGLGPLEAVQAVADHENARNPAFKLAAVRRCDTPYTSTGDGMLYVMERLNSNLWPKKRLHADLCPLDGKTWTCSIFYELGNKDLAFVPAETAPLAVGLAAILAVSKCH